jgi:hypothetical protein
VFCVYFFCWADVPRASAHVISAPHCCLSPSFSFSSSTASSTCSSLLVNHVDFAIYVAVIDQESRALEVSINGFVQDVWLSFATQEHVGHVHPVCTCHKFGVLSICLTVLQQYLDHTHAVSCQEKDVYVIKHYLFSSPHTAHRRRQILLLPLQSHRETPLLVLHACVLFPPPSACAVRVEG